MARGLLAEVVGLAADELALGEDETLRDDVTFGLLDAVVDGAADVASDEDPAVAATLDAGADDASPEDEAGESDSGGFSVPAALAAGCGGPGLLLHAPTTIRMTPISATTAMAQRSSAFRPRLPDEAVGTW